MIERLKEYIDSKNFSVRDFESQCELREGVIKMALKNKGDIGSDKLGKILTKFPDINIRWILTGVGEMIKNDEKNIQIGNNINGNNHQNINLAQIDCEKEVRHLQELLAEKEKTIADKERTIQILLNQHAK